MKGARINGSVNIAGTQFKNEVDTKSLWIGGDLETQYTKFVKKFDLSSANIAGYIDMRRSSFKDTLDAYALQTGGNFDIRNSEVHQFNLAFARIAGALDMSDANFYGPVDAFRAQVGGYVTLKNSTFFSNVSMSFAKFENNLDLRDVVIHKLDLSGAFVGGELQIGLPNDEAKWQTNNEEAPVLNLRNAHIGNLADTDKAWPDRGKIYLSGITIDHLGGTQGESEEDMLKRGASWWDNNWANLNIKYTPSPYSQLAAAFLAMGDREDANEIRYLARERERTVAWGDRKWGSWLWLSALNYIAGYGIGYRAFYVLYWVGGLSLIGAAVLWGTVPEAGKEYARQDGSIDNLRRGLWCYGASLSRLLPVIELKEFKGFFEDPACLKLWQRVTFATLGVAGWILGGVLLLAMTGLTQNP